MKFTKRQTRIGLRFWSISASILALGVLVTLLSCSRSKVTQTAVEQPVSQKQLPPIKSPASGLRTGVSPQRLALAGTTPCPPVEAKQMYRFIAGIDTCMVKMSSQEIAQELNDPWWMKVLGTGNWWPTTVPDIVDAITQANPSFVQKSYLLGEGSQIPTSVTPRDSNRDLRYVVAWGPSGQNPVIFLSALPIAVEGGTPPGFLQVIAYDSSKQGYNYYQYINNADVTNNPASNEVQTWSWAGDSSYARNPQTVDQGCFDCHLNGGLNMKELTVPWNNWQSTAATIGPNVIPEAMTADPLYVNRLGADDFQNIFQGAMFSFTTDWVDRQINNEETVTNVSELLRRLIETTTINFASSQQTSAGNSDVVVPADFFLNNSMFRSNSAMGFMGLGLSYNLPQLDLNRADYHNFLQNNQFQLVNQSPPDRGPQYSQPGSTNFAFFIPGPAYEDLVAMKELINSQIVSDKFVVCVLMVDFQNPVFSPIRSSLMQYANQISSGTADGQDIPNQFAALVAQAAESQPSCNPDNLSQCTAEQQFLHFWNLSDWQTEAENRINAYLQKVGQRIGTTEGVNDYMTLAVSRQVQFANYPGVCNLDEFTLLLPQTSLGDIFKQMNTDSTISNQPSYTCPSD